MEQDRSKRVYGMHKLSLERRGHVTVTGIVDVSSFHETEIVLRLEDCTLVITGENLHIGKLLLDEGKLDIEGKVDGINYETHRDVKRFFRK